MLGAVAVILTYMFIGSFIYVILEDVLERDDFYSVFDNNLLSIIWPVTVVVYLVKLIINLFVWVNRFYVKLFTSLFRKKGE
jgi:hypothetical protein